MLGKWIKDLVWLHISKFANFSLDYNLKLLSRRLKEGIFGQNLSKFQWVLHTRWVACWHKWQGKEFCDLKVNACCFYCCFFFFCFQGKRSYESSRPADRCGIPGLLVVTQSRTGTLRHVNQTLFSINSTGWLFKTRPLSSRCYLNLECT